MKNQIIEILSEISEDTVADRVLKSYLYLMIGNVTRSDNILIQITQRPPIENWKNFKAQKSLYTKLSIANLDQILMKFEKHPTDRRAFQLFIKYLKAFYNEATLLNSISNIKDDLLAHKLDLRYIEKISPHLVHYLRVVRFKESNRLLKLKDPKEFPFDEQSYWIWPFIDVDSIISEDFYSEIERVEKHDELWFIYLMRNEKMVDLYQKKNNKGFIIGKRKFLREQLKNKSVFMLSLYKLIEMGDIDEALVLETVKFLTNE